MKKYIYGGLCLFLTIAGLIIWSLIPASFEEPKPLTSAWSGALFASPGSGCPFSEGDFVQILFNRDRSFVIDEGGDVVCTGYYHSAFRENQHSLEVSFNSKKQLYTYKIEGSRLIIESEEGKQYTYTWEPVYRTPGSW